MSSKLHRSSTMLALLGLLAAACNEPAAKPPTPPPDGVDHLPPLPGDGAEEFVSHVAGESRAGGPEAAGSADAGNSGALPATPADDNAESDTATRAIAEADIIQLQGDRLFALSAYAGLTVIDVADPTDLQVLGRYSTSAQPFEMYLKGDVAYLMLNGYWSYEYQEESDSMGWVSTARMQALDVSDPAQIRVLGDHEITGDVSDSRMVGDVLYLVTYENGWCWRCQPTANTHVASFDVSDPSRFPKLDELRFDSESESYGPRSITVTTERMYVAGPSWTQAGSGSIQVVDISNSSGALVMGAKVAIAGPIDSRWQMDEYQGVLRVISQPGGFRTAGSPVVETFQVQDAQTLTALGSLQMHLPRPEDLRSVRFDGERAYAITFERKDPLFTLDLSDPATPVQTGELEMPGFVYHMEPRGERVYGLGFDQDNSDGGMNVSIFDVSDLAHPAMLDRVNFGTQWAHTIEDQDRIHKAFNLMLDQGLILVPYAGGESDSATCSYQYRSGIQIIEVDGDDLSLRGQAPQLGTARRSLLHRGTLLGVSDDAVQSFDISDRDAPAALDRVEVARNIASLHLMGDRILRFGQDWWTDRTLLDFTTKADANAAQPRGEIDLSQVLPSENSCNGSSNWGSQVLVHGDTAYVGRHAYSWSDQGGSYEQRLSIYVLDISEDTPKVVHSFEVDSAQPPEWYGSLVLTDHALLVGRAYNRYTWRGGATDADSNPPKFYYDIFSLEDPRAPRYVDRFEVPELVSRGGWGYGAIGCGCDMGWGWWYGGYDTPSSLVSGDILVSQHEELVKDGTKRVKYYMDRLDVSDPDQPRMLTPVNIPGKVIHFDANSGLIVTLEDSLREVEATSHDDCWWRGSRTSMETDRNGNLTACLVYDRVLNTLQLQGDVAHRISSVNLDDEANSMSVAVSGARIYSVTTDRVARDYRSGKPPLITPVVHSFAVGSDGALRLLGDSALPSRRDWYGWLQLDARGEHAFVQDSNSLHVVDTGDPESPVLTTHDMPGWSCQSLQVDESHAWCAMGKQGVLKFDL